MGCLHIFVYIFSFKLDRVSNLCKLYEIPSGALPNPTTEPFSVRHSLNLGTFVNLELVAQADLKHSGFNYSVVFNITVDEQSVQICCSKCQFKMATQARRQEEAGRVEEDIQIYRLTEL